MSDDLSPIDLSDRITEAYYGLLPNARGAFRERTRHRVHWICSQVKGDSILDIGCSQGLMSILLAREGKRCLGLDVNEKSIGQALEYLQAEPYQVRSNVAFFCADAVTHEYAKQKFDTILLAEVLEHLIHPSRLLDCAAGLLNSKGRVVVTVPFGIDACLDHKATYYGKNVFDLLTKHFVIEDIVFLDTWIGFVAVNDPSVPSIPALTAWEITESAFLRIEESLRKNISSTQAQLETEKKDRQIYARKLKEAEAKGQEARTDYDKKLAAAAGREADFARKLEDAEAKAQEARTDYDKKLAAAASEAGTYADMLITAIAEKDKLEAVSQAQFLSMREAQNTWDSRIAAILRTSSWVQLPLKFHRLWLETKKQRPPKSLGGDSFSEVHSAYIKGGFDKVEALLAKASASPAVKANGYTALSRHLQKHDAKQACEAARRAYEKDPRLFRRKWLAFQLYTAGNTLEADMMLSALPEDIVLSESERSRAEKIRATAENERITLAKSITSRHINKGDNINAVYEEKNVSRIGKHISKTLSVLHSDVISVLNGSGIRLTFRAITNQPEVLNSCLLSFRFLNHDRQPLLPQDQYKFSHKVGNYQYFQPGTVDRPAKSMLQCLVPRGAEFFHFQIISWKPHLAEVSIQSVPEFEILHNTACDVKLSPHRFLQEYLRNIDEYERQSGRKKRFLVMQAGTTFYGNINNHQLRNHRLLKEFAEKDVAVLFLPGNNFPEQINFPFVENKNIIQCSNNLCGLAIDTILERRGNNNVYMSSTLISNSVLTTAEMLFAKGWGIAYEGRDDLEEFNRLGYAKTYRSVIEYRLCKIAGRIVTVSQQLASKYEAMGIETEKIRVIQNGVAKEFMQDTAYCRTPQAYAKRAKSKVIGYIGVLPIAWFDWPLLVKTARSMPEYQFELIGNLHPEGVVLPDNIILLGKIAVEQALPHCEKWKAALIPFQRIPLTFSVDPNKIYEYLSMGLKVITSMMGDVACCPATYVYKHEYEFASKLRMAMESDFSVDEQLRIQEYISSAGWDDRADQLLEYIFKE
jgi:cyclopropane fatty-acyl-phospholipid synthase-like methyltransferase